MDWAGVIHLHKFSSSSTKYCAMERLILFIRATGDHFARWTISFFDLEVMKPSKQVFQIAKIIIPSCDPSPVIPSIISPQQDVMDWAGVEPATFRLRIEHYYH